MLMVSFGLWSSASMLTPGSASSQFAIIVARVAVGVAQGFLIPSIHTVLSQVLPIPPTGLRIIALVAKQ